MTNDTNYRGKANAVFFAAIMVVSMFAAGFAAAPAAAVAGSGAVDAGSQEVPSEGSISGTFTPDAGDTDVQIVLDVDQNGEYDSATDSFITVANDDLTADQEYSFSELSVPASSAEGSADVLFVQRSSAPTDGGAAITADSSATVTVDDTAPTVVGTPALTDETDGDGNVFEGDEVSVSATVTDSNTVDTVEADASAFGAASDVALTQVESTDEYTGTFTVGSSPDNGDVSVTVSATDLAGNGGSQATASDSLNTDGFQISNVETTNTNVFAGNDAEVTATFTNTGTSATTQTVNADLGVGQDAQQISLSPDSSQEVTFAVTTESADVGGGPYSVTVTSNEDSDSSASDFTVQESGSNFDVTVDAVEDPVTEGDDVEYDITVDNTGNEEDSQDLSWTLTDGEGEVDTGSIAVDNLAPDDDPFTTTSTFSDLEVEDYTLTVDSDDDTGSSATVTVQEAGDFVDTDYDVEIDNGSTTYQGQRLLVDAGALPDGTTNSSVELRSVNDDSEVAGLVSRPDVVTDTDDHNYFIIETEDRSADRYVLTEASQGTDVAKEFTFEVVAQDLTTEFDDDSVSDTGADALVDYELNSDNRNNNYAVNVEAEGLDEEDFEQIFGNEFDDQVTEDIGAGDGEYDTEEAAVYARSNSVDAGDFALNDDEGYITLFQPENDAHELNFTDIDAGDYEFNVSVIDTPAEDTDSVTVEDIGDAEVNIEESSLTQQQGDIVEFNVTSNGAAGSGSIVVGDAEDFGYQANVSIDDFGDDDQITLAFNTYTAGDTDADPVTVVDTDDDDDAITVAEQTELQSILESGNYDISSGATSDYNDVLDSSDDVATLFIEERSTTGIQLWTASQDNADEVTDADDDEQLNELNNAVENDLVTQTNTVAHDDVLVHQISASGLEGAIEAEQDNGDASSDEEAFANLVNVDQTDGEYTDQSKLQLRIRETSDSAGANTERGQLSLSQNNFDLVIDEENDEYYVVQQLPTSFSNGDDVENDEDYTFDVDFAVRDEQFVVDHDDDDFDQDAYDQAVDDGRVTATFDLEERSLTFDQDPFNVSNVEDAEVTGETNAAPGTEFTVRARSDSDTQPAFVNTDDEVSVSADGTFAAVLDFGDQNVGDGYTLSVQQLGLNDPGDVEVDGTVVEQTQEPATFEVSDLNPAEATATAGDSVDVSATIENTGGAEGTQTVALTLDGDELDTSEVTLADGNSTTVEFSADTSGLEAGDYTHGVATDDDEATGTLTIEAAGDDSSGDDSSGDDSSGDDSSGDDSTGDDSSGDGNGTDDSTDDGTPGFGALVALVALIAAALLATRRNE